MAEGLVEGLLGEEAREGEVRGGARRARAKYALAVPKAPTWRELKVAAAAAGPN